MAISYQSCFTRLARASLHSRPRHCAAMLCGLLIAMPGMAELTVGPRPTGRCTLFEHRDMQGARLRLPANERVSFARGDVGSSAWRELPSWNDVVSSARVDAGCRLRVWEHMLGQGASKEWSGGSKGLLVKYVGDAWNDRVSSATCLCN